MAAVGALAVGVLGAGFSTGFGSEASAEPTAQAFLLDWHQGKYVQAARLTDGNAGQVAAELKAAAVDLGATNTLMSMGPIRQRGTTAAADFRATVDLARAGLQWTYTGHFRLAATGGHWVVHWAPSVINPHLAAGERLAVVTTFPPRAQIEDVSGGPLVTKSLVYHVYVIPAELADPAATAAKFSQITGISKRQVLRQIRSAPPAGALTLLTLDKNAFLKLLPKLNKVPQLGHEPVNQPLFRSRAPEAVGTVGTENAAELRAEGAAYQPGMTVGLTGLEQAYQNQLVGTPTTSVVVVKDIASAIVAKPVHVVATLWSSRGHAGTPVRTTLSDKDQTVARKVLTALPQSGEIVAVDARNGAVRALASRQAGSSRLPAGGTLNGKITSGTSLFAQMSRKLGSATLAKTERAFGVGATWRLRMHALSGSAAAISGETGAAEQVTGSRGALMSPLGMAMVAAEVASGTGHAPVLVAGNSPDSWPVPLSASRLTEIRRLMRLAASSQSAPYTADVPGKPVYGQSGVVKTGKNTYLSWFFGYRGSLAVATVEVGATPDQAAAALAGAFYSAVR